MGPGETAFEESGARRRASCATGFPSGRGTANSPASGPAVIPGIPGDSGEPGIRAGEAPRVATTCAEAVEGPVVVVGTDDGPVATAAGRRGTAAGTSSATTRSTPEAGCRGGSARGPGGAARDAARGAGKARRTDRGRGCPTAAGAVAAWALGGASLRRKGRRQLLSPVGVRDAWQAQQNGPRLQSRAAGTGSPPGDPRGLPGAVPSLPFPRRECVAQHLLPLCAGFGSADHFVHIGASILPGTGR